MLVKLTNGLTLSLQPPLPGAPDFSDPLGYFILDGRANADPDLSVTPAYYIPCEALSDVYELKQREVVLGMGSEVVR